MWGYYCIITTYLIVYWWLKMRDKSILRLLLDYFFINIIVYNSNLYSPIVFTLIILPIINAINFSGEKSNYVLLVILSCLTFYIHSFTFDVEFIILMSGLSLIYLYSNKKYKKIQIEQNISQSIDAYFLNPNIFV